MFYTGALSNCIYVSQSALYKESCYGHFYFSPCIEATKCLVKSLLSTTWF